MSNADQESWTRVKERLRADVGDDVYSSWFARMDLEGLEDKTVRLAVPTRFLKSWIQSHYAERVLACWQAHDDNVARIELTVRSAVLRTNIPVTPRGTAPAGNATGERKVLYLTAEKFMYGFVSAIRTQTALAFKEALRGIGVLVIDDLQFLQGKSTQAEFCHTLNALIDAGRQEVIASDRPPSDLESLDDRVRSRLAGGRVVEMGALGEELRLEILKSRVSAARVHHASFDVPLPVLDYLAKAITHNGRDLEGAINRLLAHSKLNSTPVTLEMAER